MPWSTALDEHGAVHLDAHVRAEVWCPAIARDRHHAIAELVLRTLPTSLAVPEAKHLLHEEDDREHLRCDRNYAAALAEGDIVPRV